MTVKIEDDGPELLAALRTMHAWIEIVANELDLDPDETRVTVNAVGPSGARELATLSLTDVDKIARAAIARAEGGAA